MKPADPPSSPRTAPPPPYDPQRQSTPMLTQSAKNRGTFIVLGLFLGCLGIHNFYAGYHGKGAAQLIITLVLGWIVVGVVITGIWALVDVCTVRDDANGLAMA